MAHAANEISVVARPCRTTPDPVQDSAASLKKVVGRAAVAAIYHNHRTEIRVRTLINIAAQSVCICIVERIEGTIVNAISQPVAIRVIIDLSTATDTRFYLIRIIRTVIYAVHCPVAVCVHIVYGATAHARDHFERVIWATVDTIRCAVIVVVRWVIYNSATAYALFLLVWIKRAFFTRIWGAVTIGISGTIGRTILAVLRNVSSALTDAVAAHLKSAGGRRDRAR